MISAKRDDLYTASITIIALGVTEWIIGEVLIAIRGLLVMLLCNALLHAHWFLEGARHSGAVADPVRRAGGRAF